MQYGLIGAKLGHSYSPMIHAHLGDYRYELKEIAPEALGEFIRSRDFAGFNVTIPYKRDVLPYLDEISPVAREIGCVNTVVQRADGSLYGHNTDIAGFTHMLARAGISAEGRKAAILGSGGTSRTAQTALRHMNAREIIVVSRSGPITYEDLVRSHGDIELLVNTTPVGMYPHTGVSPVSLDAFPLLQGVADVIYNPSRTALILDAMEKGIPCVSGLSMLVAQAREAAECFTGRAIDPDVDEQILSDIQKSALNLVLVGMPGCGKSSLGRKLAEWMGRPFLDSDEEIVRQAGMPIEEIFARDGEARFREIEAEVLARLGRESGAIIATGGGAVLRGDNRRAMKQNGRICMILRELESLSMDGRPLSLSREALKAMWERRRPLYEAARDYTVDNNADLDTAARAALEGFYEAAGH